MFVKIKIVFVFFLFLVSASNIALSQDTYDRVVKSGEIKCGYTIWVPVLMKDPNTGELSGIFKDYLEALGKSLSLKIVWSHEIGWGDFPTALEAGKIDAMCAGIWPTASRARVIDFIKPIYFNSVNAYVRNNDKRFDEDLSKINDASVVISTMDGEMSSIIAKADFPNAKTVSVPQLSDLSMILLNVEKGKADITFADTSTANGYMASNPNSIRMIEGGSAVRVFGNTIAIAADQYRFKSMLDNATNELINSGKIEKILKKYEKYPNSLLRAASPYKEK